MDECVSRCLCNEYIISFGSEGLFGECVVLLGQ